MGHVLHGLTCVSLARSSRLLSEFREAGAEHFMVVADFDYTLTIRKGANAEQGCLTHEIFDCTKRMEGSNSTIGELQRLMNMNYKTTYSLCSSDEERASVNNEWWNASHDMIVRSMLHINDIPNLVRCSRLIWRRNVRQFFEVLEQSCIPLIIFSAGVSDIIKEAIRQTFGYIPGNIAVAGNVMHFNEDGYVSSLTNPPVHSLCKNITRLRELIPDLDKKYENRTNAFVIGDSDSDACMVDEWKGKRLLKIGLQAEERPPLNSFDILIGGSDCTRLTDIVKFVILPQQL